MIKFLLTLATVV
jgi:lysosomal acid lipase/cholesteryl ester hydrolase